MRAEVAKCARCGAVIVDRGALTPLPCPLALAAQMPVAPTARASGARVWTAAEIATIRADALAEGEARGRDVERGRVLRLLNVAFTGKRLDTDLATEIVKLCDDVRRGRDVTS